MSPDAEALLTYMQNAEGSGAAAKFLPELRAPVVRDVHRRYVDALWELSAFNRFKFMFYVSCGAIPWPNDFDALIKEQSERVND